MKNKLFTFFLFYFVFTNLHAKNTLFGFIENKGQLIDQYNNKNSQTKYILIKKGIKLQLKKNSFSYEILKSEQFYKKATLFSVLTVKDYASRSEKEKWLKKISDSTIVNSQRIDIELLNANKNPRLIPEGQSEDYLNYYTTSTPENGVTNVHHYSKITYKDIYPNIDLEFVLDGTNKQPFKYNFIVRPGGRVSDILLQYNGADSTKLTPAGSLNLATAYGNVEENIPSSYIAETGKEITVNYQQNREGVYGISAGNYNLQQTLVIDPIVSHWCTYFGWDGSQSQGQNGSSDLVTDNANNIYVIGTTDITTNIASVGSHQTIYGGGVSDAFIRKFSSNGTPIWCTYYGGTDNDNASGIACDEFNNIYITGVTYSPNNIATLGSFLSTIPITPWTSFLSKFNSNGVRQWGTYYPANSYRIAKDHLNNIIIGGYAEDTSAVTFGAHQTTPGGNGDDFIAKFNSNGARQWGTFYGGSELEKFTIDISTDTQNNIFLSGTTASNNNISTSSSYQQTFGGVSDNFLAKFNSFGVRQWGTYYGGVGDEENSTNITTNISGDFYFAGAAESNGIFATLGSFQNTLSGALDYCLAKFNTNGQRLWGTYFGGNNDDQVYSLYIDLNGNPTFVGSSLSTNIIGSLGSLQPNFTVGAPGWADGFIEKFSPSGSRLWGTYFGSTGNESIVALAIDNLDNIVISGATNSKGLATIGAYQTTLIDTLYGDIFLASLDSNGTFTTGIGDVNSKTSLINFYPNPAKDKITVSIKDDAGKGGSLVLMDIEGKAVKSVITLRQAQGDKDIVIDVKDLSAGVYLLQYDDGEVCETVKFVKE